MPLCDFNIKGSHSLINGRGDSLLLGPEPRPFVPASLLQQLKSNVLFCQLVLFVVTEVWTETHRQLVSLVTNRKLGSGTTLPNTVEPLNKGHYGANDIVPCRKVVLSRRSNNTLKY